MTMPLGADQQAGAEARQRPYQQVGGGAPRQAGDGAGDQAHPGAYANPLRLHAMVRAAGIRHEPNRLRELLIAEARRALPWRH